MKLRKIAERDLPQLLKWRNDPRIYKWCRQQYELCEREHRVWFESLPKRPEIEMYALEDDGLVGVCGLTSIDYVARRAEFSLYIDPERHRSGLGRQGLKALLRHGFDVLNLNLIWGESFQDNPAIQMFQKLGFVFEGTRREFYYKQGQYVDAHLFSIKRGEFIKADIPVNKSAIVNPTKVDKKPPLSSTNTNAKKREGPFIYSKKKRPVINDEEKIAKEEQGYIN